MSQVKDSNNITSKPDYVLGTHNQENARLGMQHSLWREFVLDAWKRAGIGAGSSVVDVARVLDLQPWILRKLLAPLGM